jgi:hypothetical protein
MVASFQICYVCSSKNKQQKRKLAMTQSIQGTKLSAIKNIKSNTSNSTKPFFEQLPDILDLDSLIDEHCAIKRDRIFTPTVTLNLFMRQVMNADKSCQQIVSQASLEALSLSLKTCSSNTAAYCKARQALPLPLIKGAAQRLGYWLEEHSHEQWKWLGRTVKLIDAATVSMPDTDKNQKAFPQNCAQKEGLGFPICRISGITSLATGALLEASIGDYYISEHVLSEKLLTNLSEEDILVGDSLYSSYFFISQFSLRKIDCVCKLRSSRKFSSNAAKKLGKNDYITEWKKPKKPARMTQEYYDQLPDKMLVREIQKNNTRFITTLQDKGVYAKNKIIKLYKERWNVELDIRSIKTIMQMDILRCKSPEMIIKEIWMHFLAYNFIRSILVEASLLEKISPRKLSFKKALQSLRTVLSIYVLINRKIKNQTYNQLITIIRKRRVGNRPGRAEPRLVKRRTNLKYMTRPRHILKQELVHAMS